MGGSHVPNHSATSALEPPLGIEPSPLPYRGSAPPWSYDGRDPRPADLNGLDVQFLPGTVSRWRVSESNRPRLVCRTGLRPSGLPVGLSDRSRTDQHRVPNAAAHLGRSLRCSGAGGNRTRVPRLPASCPPSWTTAPFVESARIELAFSACDADVFPLDDDPVFAGRLGIEPSEHGFGDRAPPRGRPIVLSMKQLPLVESGVQC